MSARQHERYRAPRLAVDYHILKKPVHTVVAHQMASLGDDPSTAKETPLELRFAASIYLSTQRSIPIMYLSSYPRHRLQNSLYSPGLMARIR